MFIGNQNQSTLRRKSKAVGNSESLGDDLSQIDRESRPLQKELVRQEDRWVLEEAELGEGCYRIKVRAFGDDPETLPMPVSDIFHVVSPSGQQGSGVIGPGSFGPMAISVRSSMSKEEPTAVALAGARKLLGTCLSLRKGDVFALFWDESTQKLREPLVTAANEEWS